MLTTQASPLVALAVRFVNHRHTTIALILSAGALSLLDSIHSRGRIDWCVVAEAMIAALAGFAPAAGKKAA